MVVIDQYSRGIRQSPFAGLLRLFSREAIRPILSAPKFLFRRTDTEIQRRRILAAERISANAGQPTSQPCVEPARLTTQAIAERLAPCAAHLESAVDDVTMTTADALLQLDRIEYDLLAIRTELEPFLTMETRRPCERSKGRP